MKKLILLLAIILYLSTIEASPSNIEMNNPGFVIRVKSADQGNDYLFLSRRIKGDWSDIDSARLSKGASVEFSGTLNSPEVLYLRLENSDKPISFFAENSTIVILPDFDNPENTKVSGSSVHDEYTAYLSLFAEMNQERQILIEQYNEARQSGDEKKMEAVVAKFDGFADQEMEINREYVKTNRGSWVSPYVIRKSMYYTLGTDELKSIVNGLDSKIQNSVYVDELKKHIAILERVGIGQKFTDFTLPTPEGKDLSLSEITGANYILIDFWASWCGPCRRENPHVVAMYNEFKDKGFDIIGVSLDKSRENWIKAIDDDNLNWHHVSDLKGWGSSAGQLYGVNSIPHTVLLDPEGTIIGKNLRGDALKEKLEEVLID